MIEISDKYFSENTADYLKFCYKTKEISSAILEAIENNKEADEDDMLFMYNCFSSLT